MPIYEYKCPKCEVVQEKLQKISDPPPECEGEDQAAHDPVEMKKIISVSSFSLKGGGWAADGYE